MLVVDPGVRYLTGDEHPYRLLGKLVLLVSKLFVSGAKTAVSKPV